MIKVTLEYGSVEEAIVALGRLAQVAKVRRAAQGTAGASETQGAQQPAVDTATTGGVSTPAPAAPATSITKNLVLPDTTRKPRGRPRKTEAAPVPAAPAAAPPATPDPVAAPETASSVPANPAAPTPSEADAKAALETYFEKHGPQKAIAVLAGFGVSRLRDLPEGQRAEFIKACQ